MAKKKTAEERRRRAAEMKAQRLKADRRRKLLTIAGVSTAAVLVLGLLAVAIFMEIRSRNIAGMEEFEIGAAGHVETGQRVDYEQSPPVGGEHWNQWQNCGVYPEPVTPEFAVHAMEHGAVWINYAPDLPEDQVQTLLDMYSPGAYLVISPYEGEMDAPIAASSWGRQVTVESADDEELSDYVQRFERGSDVPEPGAACSGGVAESAAEIEAVLSGEAEAPAGGMEGAEEDAPAGDTEGENTEGDGGGEDAEAEEE